MRPPGRTGCSACYPGGPPCVACAVALDLPGLRAQAELTADERDERIDARVRRGGAPAPTSSAYELADMRASRVRR